MINVFDCEVELDRPLWYEWLSSGGLCRKVSRVLAFALFDISIGSIEREDFD